MGSIFKDFGPGRQVAALVRRWGGGHPVSDSSAAAYDAGRSGLDDALKAILGDGGPISQSDIDADPLYALDVQAADQRYGGGGGSGLAAKISQAIAENAYAGPSMAQLQAYGDRGRGIISDEYAQMQNAIQSNNAQSASNLAQGTQNITGYYDTAQKDVAASNAAAVKNLQDEASIAAQQQGNAAAAAPMQSYEQKVQGNLQAALQREADQVAANRATALSSQQAMVQGQQNIGANLLSGLQTEKGTQTGNWNTQVNSLISKAQAEMADAAARQQKAAQAIRDSAAGDSGKQAAAKTDALKNAIKRAQSEKGKEKTLTGIKGVLAYAMKMNKPQLAQKFIDLIHTSKANAATINEKAAKDKLGGILPTSGGLVKTTWEDEFQKALSGSAGERYDIGDLSNNDLWRGGLLEQIRSKPELAALKKYIISDPNTARKLGLYEQAFGKNREQYRKGLGVSGTGLDPNKILSMADFYGPNVDPRIARTRGYKQSQEFENAMNRQFTPFLNLGALRANPNDLRSYYGYFDSAIQDQSTMATMLDILQGRFGKGGF